MSKIEEIEQAVEQLPLTDFVKLAEGMGVEASRAETTAEFSAQFADAMQTRGPRLIEAVLSA